MLLQTQVQAHKLAAPLLAAGSGRRPQKKSGRQACALAPSLLPMGAARRGHCLLYTSDAADDM
eukprot:976501-Prymnesium_polylepis.2